MNIKLLKKLRKDIKIIKQKQDCYDYYMYSNFKWRKQGSFYLLSYLYKEVHGIIRYRLKKYNKNIFNLLLIVFLFVSCTPTLKTTDQIDNMLNDIYKQKVLLCVFKSKGGSAIFESPIGNKQYLCTSSIESKRWNVGDTLIIKYKGKLLSKEDEKTILSLKPHRKKK